MKDKTVESKENKEDKCCFLEVIGIIAIGVSVLFLVWVSVDAIGDAINKNIDKRIVPVQRQMDRTCSLVKMIDEAQDREIYRLTKLINTQPKEVQKKIDDYSETRYRGFVIY